MLEQKVSVKLLIEALERLQKQNIETIDVYELLHILPSDEDGASSEQVSEPPQIN